ARPCRAARALLANRAHGGSRRLVPRVNLPVPPNPLPRSASRTEAALRLIALATHGHRLRRMEIRPAREDEIEPLTQLFIRARNEVDYLPRVPDEAAVPIAARIREHEEVWVAEEEGRLLSFLGIEHSTNLGAPVLEKLYVEP